MKNIFITLTFLLLAFAGSAQETGYDIYGTHTKPGLIPNSLFVTLDTLKGAKTLKDIHGRYHSDWVARYLSVEISTNCNGVVKKARSQNDTLSRAQLRIMETADWGCNIDFEVHYIPKNKLKDNPPRTMNFSLTAIPVYEAQYPGGYSNLKKYLKENIIDKIPAETLARIKLATVKFTINEKGQLTAVRIVASTEEKKIDGLILDALCNMPDWLPAEDLQGKKVTQDLEFSMGTSLLMCPPLY